jgi:hypothetical protein
MSRKTSTPEERAYRTRLLTRALAELVRDQHDPTKPHDDAADDAIPLWELADAMVAADIDLGDTIRCGGHGDGGHYHEWRLRLEPLPTLEGVCPDCRGTGIHHRRGGLCGECFGVGRVEARWVDDSGHWTREYLEERRSLAQEHQSWDRI